VSCRISDTLEHRTPPEQPVLDFGVRGVVVEVGDGHSGSLEILLEQFPLPHQQQWPVVDGAAKAVTHPRHADDGLEQVDGHERDDPLRQRHVGAENGRGDTRSLRSKSPVCSAVRIRRSRPDRYTSA
jgi:hypothetical protein